MRTRASTATLSASIRTDIAGTADAILQGLEISEHDRTRRNRGLVRTIAGHTPSTWLADWLETLDEMPRRGGNHLSHVIE